MMKKKRKCDFRNNGKGAFLSLRFPKCQQTLKILLKKKITLLCKLRGRDSELQIIG